MTPVERVLLLCGEKGIKISKLERDLEFANGYVKGLKAGKFSAERVKKIADYLEVSYSEVDPEMFPPVSEYYVDPQTAEIAQQIFDNRELRVLFDAARDAKPDDLKTAYDVLLALKRKEEYSGDDPA